MKTMAKYSLPLLSLFLLVLFGNAKAQRQYDWSKYYSRPFSENNFRDTLSITKKRMDAFGRIDDIRNSKADIEIRYYPSPGGLFGMTTWLTQLKCTRDNISVNAYGVRINKGDLVDSMYIDSQGRFLWLYEKNNVSIEKHTIDSILTALDSSGFFVIRDQKLLIDSLRQIKKNTGSNDAETRLLYPYLGCSDCNTGFDIIEIKCGNKFRSIYMAHNPLDYYVNSFGVDGVWIVAINKLAKEFRAYLKIRDLLLASCFHLSEPYRMSIDLR